MKTRNEIKKMLKELGLEKKTIDRFLDGYEIDLLNEYDKMTVDFETFMLCNTKIGACISITINI